MNLLHENSRASKPSRIHLLLVWVTGVECGCCTGHHRPVPVPDLRHSPGLGTQGQGTGVHRAAWPGCLPTASSQGWTSCCWAGTSQTPLPYLMPPGTIPQSQGVQQHRTVAEDLVPGPAGAPAGLRGVVGNDPSAVTLAAQAVPQARTKHTPAHPNTAQHSPTQPNIPPHTARHTGMHLQRGNGRTTLL